METTALPVPEAVRPRTVVVASVLATGAAAMAFLGLIAIYITRRAAATASGEEWFSEGAIELGPAGMMMLTLLLSSVTVQWAVQAVGDDDRPHGLMALGLSLLFGVAVLNQFWFLYQDTGFTIDGSEAELLFYVVTGAFIVMLMVAMLFVALTALRALAGQLNSRHIDGVQAAAVYWHTVVVLYGVVWYAIFITK
jgi:heme/copper-type cytochrome/quinol oxidase subunit 3